MEGEVEGDTVGLIGDFDGECERSTVGTRLALGPALGTSEISEGPELVLGT